MSEVTGKNYYLTRLRQMQVPFYFCLRSRPGSPNVVRKSVTTLKINDLNDPNDSDQVT